MIGIASSAATPSAYVCNMPVGEVQSQFSSAVASTGAGSSSTSDVKCLLIDFSSYMPLAFFEEMRSSNDDFLCFGQITKIFLGAYKKKDDSMIVKTLRFMQNFNYDEIGQVGISAARMALLDSKSLDVQSAALSLVLCWKAEEFKNILSAYHAPKDPFINIKMRKISAWCTSVR